MSSRKEVLLSLLREIDGDYGKTGVSYSRIEPYGVFKFVNGTNKTRVVTEFHESNCFEALDKVYKNYDKVFKE